MSKLYLFAIGGTGTRVLNSLLMLLASGVRANTEKIIPMVIDTDINNGDLERFRKQLRNYREINEKLYADCSMSDFQDHFFRTRIEDPRELNISGLDYGTLGDMLDCTGLAASGFKNTKFLVDLLFNYNNLSMKLEKGFLGNPNVGSIVLKNVIETKGFKEFTQAFQAGDRIFIINSIFGGTGAAGFPLLLRVFRDNVSELNNIGLINNSIIGGVTVLPYFEVDVEKYQSGESSINSNTFISKTKAALSYYDDHIGHLVNALYYIGDTQKSNYENIEGGTEQKNPNNFVEFVSALAILDFLNYESSSKTINDLGKPTRYFEFGIGDDVDTLNFTHLPGREDITRPLIAFKYFSVYVSKWLRKALEDKKLVWRRGLNIPNNYWDSSFIKALRSFCGIHFYKWLYNLNHKSHSRKFVPFNLRILNPEDAENGYDKELNVDIDEAGLFTMVNGIPAKQDSSFLKKDKIKFDDIFTDYVDEINSRSLSSTELNFLSLMCEGISHIYSERYRN